MPFIKKINKPTTKNIKNKKKIPLRNHQLKQVSSNSNIVEQIQSLLKKIK